MSESPDVSRPTSEATSAKSSGKPQRIWRRKKIGELPERLMSVDALRGFDMFWILGMEEVANHCQIAMSSGPGSSSTSACSTARPARPTCW